MPNGGTVPKARTDQTWKPSRTARVGDQSASEEAILRLGRLIGRQMARDAIRSRRYDSLDEDGSQMRQDPSRTSSTEG